MMIMILMMMIMMMMMTIIMMTRPPDKSAISNYISYFSKHMFCILKRNVLLNSKGLMMMIYLYGHSSPRLHSPFTQNEHI